MEKLQVALDGLIVSLSLLLTYALPAGVARLLWHWRLVRLGHRSPFDRAALIELPAAAFGIWIGVGLSDYFGLSQQASFAMVVFSSWLGPGGLQALLIWRLEKLGVIPKKEKD